MTTIPLTELRDWTIENDRIEKTTNDEFHVEQIAIETDVREVSAWDQPIISSSNKSLNGMLCKNINGIPHFLVKGHVEPGNADTIELTCGIQTNERNSEVTSDKSLYDRISGDKLHAKKVLLTTINSEEGGRFYHDENIYQFYLLHGNITGIVADD